MVSTHPKTLFFSQNISTKGCYKNTRKLLGVQGLMEHVDRRSQRSNHQPFPDPQPPKTKTETQDIL